MYFAVYSLHQHLIEHLNAEIVLGTITDVSVSLEWLRSTFLYIRVNKNPKHYGLLSFLGTKNLQFILIVSSCNIVIRNAHSTIHKACN